MTPMPGVDLVATLRLVPPSVRRLLHAVVGLSALWFFVAIARAAGLTTASVFTYTSIVVLLPVAALLGVAFVLGAGHWLRIEKRRDASAGSEAALQSWGLRHVQGRWDWSGFWLPAPLLLRFGVADEGGGKTLWAMVKQSRQPGVGVTLLLRERVRGNGTLQEVPSSPEPTDRGNRYYAPGLRRFLANARLLTPEAMDVVLFAMSSADAAIEAATPRFVIPHGSVLDRHLRSRPIPAHERREDLEGSLLALLDAATSELDIRELSAAQRWCREHEAPFLAYDLDVSPARMGATLR